MKRLAIFTGISFLAVTFYSAQKVSDYQYIIVPAKFGDFNANQYQLNSRLTTGLKAKKYMVLPAEEEKWPADAQQNPCSVLTADVKNNSNMLRNRLILQFTDCRKNIVEEIKTTSLEKDFEPGYQDALQKAVVQVAVSVPQDLSSAAGLKAANNQNTTTPAAAVSDVAVAAPVTGSTSSPVAASTPANPGKAEIFTFQNEDFQKVQIGNGQFILVSGNSSVPLATFAPTTRVDVFRVSLPDGSMTLGYLENGNLSVEMPAADGKMVKQVFLRK